MPSVSSIAAACPAPAVLSDSVRRSVVAMQAATSRPASLALADEVLPDYAEVAQIQAPPRYNPFSTTKQAYWHLSGMPRLAGAVAALLPLSAGAAGAPTLYRASVQQAIKTCAQAVTRRPHLCAWTLDNFTLTADACRSLCETNSSALISAAGVDVSSFADPTIRGVLTGGVVIASAAAAVGAFALGAAGAQKLLHHRRPDVVATRQRNVQDTIEMQAFGGA